MGVAVYPKPARLITHDNDQASIDVNLKPHEKLVVSDTVFVSRHTSLGEGKVDQYTIEPKGFEHTPITVTKIRPRPSIVTGVGYTAGFGHARVLDPRHSMMFPVRFDHKRLMWGIQGGVGFDKKAYPRWAYRVLEAGAAVFAGAVFDFGYLRTDVSFSFGLYRLWQYYDSGGTRVALQYTPTIELGVAASKNKRFILRLAVGGGLLSAPGRDANSQKTLTGTAGINLSVLYRLF